MRPYILTILSSQMMTLLMHLDQIKVLTLGQELKDVILGSLGNDTIRSGDGNDLIFGRGGNDLIYSDDVDSTELNDDVIFGDDGIVKIQGVNPDTEVTR